MSELLRTPQNTVQITGLHGIKCARQLMTDESITNGVAI